jgi:putative peptidoglycan lipid II flippase
MDEPRTPASSEQDDTAIPLPAVSASQVPAASDSKAVARSGLVMAAGTLTSRVLGLIRASLLGGIIGTAGLTAESFQVANTLPNAFYILLAGGILNAVLVPQIVKANTHADGGQEFVNRIITLAVAFLAVATLLTTTLAPWLVRIYFDTTDGAALTLSTFFAFICLPQIFFYGLYTVLGQVLNAHGRFAAYMWAPVVANVVSLAGLIAFKASGFPSRAPADAWTDPMVWVLAGSATLSIAMQALVLLLPLRRMGYRYRPVWGYRGVGLGSASRVALWTFAAVVVSQLGFIVTSKVLTRATTLGDALHVVVPGRASFDNAFLLFMLPHSLVTVSLVTALFTRMSHAAHAADRDELAHDLRRGLTMPAVILVPAVALGIAFGPLVTRVFWSTTPLPQTHAVAVVMMALFVGVVPFGWLYLSERFFYAHEDARTPFFIQLVVTGTALAVTLFASTLDPRRTGIAVGLGQSTAYLLGAVIGFSLIRRRLGGLRLGGVARTYLALVVPSVVVAIGLRYAAGVLAADSLNRPLVGLVVLGVVGAVGLPVILAGAHLLGAREVSQLVAPLTRRLHRS